MNEIIAFCGLLSQAEQQEWLRELTHLLDDVDIISFEQLSNEQKKQVTVAIVANPNPLELDQLVNLQWVQSLWSGVEKLVSQLSNKQVKIIRMIDPKLSSNMAEAVLTFTLFLHRNVQTYINQQNKKQWIEHELIDSKDCNVGILGLGELGKASAQKLVANDFNVIGWSRNHRQLYGVECFHGKNGFIEILKKSNILICLLPLTNQTKNLLNKETLKCLPSNASLINFSRGPIVNEEDLLELLETKHLNHAVLDVFNVEPLPENHPFWESSKVTILPHISAPTDVKSASKIVAINIRQFIESGKIPTPIDQKKGY
ncbi:MAG: glyoxylate/hydroxypyruvate reductase A [Alcanivoracaceae bacterium]|nr:glyoxylate/hydroxypyruvate reductase A [Alcanivoracaceae bacterium]